MSGEIRLRDGQRSDQDRAGRDPVAGEREEERCAEKTQRGSMLEGRARTVKGQGTSQSVSAASSSGVGGCASLPGEEVDGGCGSAEEGSKTSGDGGGTRRGVPIGCPQACSAALVARCRSRRPGRLRPSRSAGRAVSGGRASGTMGAAGVAGSCGAIAAA